MVQVLRWEEMAQKVYMWYRTTRQMCHVWDACTYWHASAQSRVPGAPSNILQKNFFSALAPALQFPASLLGFTHSTN